MAIQKIIGGHQPTYKGPISDPPKVLPAYKVAKDTKMKKEIEQEKAAILAWAEETTKLITDILFRLNKIENRLDKLEDKEEYRELAFDDNWLNDLIDEVNAYKEKEE